MRIHGFPTNQSSPNCTADEYGSFWLSLVVGCDLIRSFDLYQQFIGTKQSIG